MLATLAVAGVGGAARAGAEFEYGWTYQVNGALAWEEPATVIPGALGLSRTFTDEFPASFPGGVSLGSLVAGNADLGARTFGARAEATARVNPWDPNRGSAQVGASQAVAEIRFTDRWWFSNPQGGPGRELTFDAHPLHLSGELTVPAGDLQGLGGAHLLVVFELTELPLTPTELTYVQLPVNVEKVLPDGNETSWSAATSGALNLTPQFRVREDHEYDVTLKLRVVVDALSMPFPAVLPPQVVSYARFQQTLGWNGIAGIHDTAGNPVNDVQMFSASGLDWLTPSAAAAVPEPPAWALWLAALGVLAARRCAAARPAQR